VDKLGVHFYWPARQSIRHLWQSFFDEKRLSYWLKAVFSKYQFLLFINLYTFRLFCNFFLQFHKRSFELFFGVFYAIEVLDEPEPFHFSATGIVEKKRYKPALFRFLFGFGAASWNEFDGFTLT